MRWDQPAKLRKLLKSAKNVVIVTHWSPDGDAMGSSLGLHHYLHALGIRSRVIVPNAYADFLHWLPGDKKVLNFQEDEVRCTKEIKKADLIFTLDFNTYKRLEKLGKQLESAVCPKVLIDHHQQPDDYASVVFHDVKASSTCELIYRLMKHMHNTDLLNRNIATCLYTGIMTDTGSFRYPAVTPETHAVVSALLETGIRHSEIHSNIYDSYSEDRMRLLGFALSNRMKVMKDIPAAYFVLPDSDLQKFSYVKGDLEGVVNYPFAIKGIKLCCMISETDGQVKMSFRSKGDIDVNVFARTYFSGGGHVNAAGGKGTGSIEDTEKKFLQHVKELFEK